MDGYNPYGQMMGLSPYPINPLAQILMGVGMYKRAQREKWETTFSQMLEAAQVIGPQAMRELPKNERFALTAKRLGRGQLLDMLPKLPLTKEERDLKGQEDQKKFLEDWVGKLGTGQEAQGQPAGPAMAGLPAGPIAGYPAMFPGAQGAAGQQMGAQAGMGAMPQQQAPAAFGNLPPWALRLAFAPEIQADPIQRMSILKTFSDLQQVPTEIKESEARTRYNNALASAAEARAEQEKVAAEGIAEFWQTYDSPEKLSQHIAGLVQKGADPQDLPPDAQNLTNFITWKMINTKDPTAGYADIANYHAGIQKAIQEYQDKLDEFRFNIEEARAKGDIATGNRLTILGMQQGFKAEELAYQRETQWGGRRIAGEYGLKRAAITQAGMDRRLRLREAIPGASESIRNQIALRNSYVSQLKSLLGPYGTPEQLQGADAENARRLLGQIDGIDRVLDERVKQMAPGKPSGQPQTWRNWEGWMTTPQATKWITEGALRRRKPGADVQQIFDNLAKRFRAENKNMTQDQQDYALGLIFTAINNRATGAR